MPEVAEHLPDTGYYVYGVVPASGTTAKDLPADLRGLDDAPVQLVPYGDVAAAVAEIRLERPPGRRAELIAHGEVVGRLAEAGPVVPVQFGSVLESRDAVVHELLEDGHDHFVEVLHRLEGRRQLNLRVSYVEDEVLAEVVRDRPDIADLRRRTQGLPQGSMHPSLIRLGELVSQAVEERRGEDAEDVLELLEAHAERIVEREPGTMEVLDVALLVLDEQLDELEDALETYAEAVHERMRLRLVGPVAPYDFVEESTWA